MAESLDIVIPVHPKDAAIPPRCVDGLRRHLSPRPGRVIAITPDPGLDRQLRALGLEVLHDRDFTELVPRAEIPPIVHRGRDYTGWYYQQLLKFAVRTRVATPRYAIVDADTVAIAPLPLVDGDGRAVLYASDQRHLPYFATYRRLFGEEPPERPSFICNYLLFEVGLVDALCRAIEARHPGLTWDRAILAAIDRGERASFSEFETYGNFASAAAGERLARGGIRNLERRRKHHWRRWWIEARARRQGFLSVSYHNYRR